VSGVCLPGEMLLGLGDGGSKMVKNGQAGFQNKRPGCPPVQAIVKGREKYENRPGPGTRWVHCEVIGAQASPR